MAQAVYVAGSIQYQFETVFRLFWKVFCKCCPPCFWQRSRPIVTPPEWQSQQADSVDGSVKSVAKHDDSANTSDSSSDDDEQPSDAMEYEAWVQRQLQWVPDRAEDRKLYGFSDVFEDDRASVWDRPVTRGRRRRSVLTHYTTGGADFSAHNGAARRKHQRDDPIDVLSVSSV